jgi:hypothetical protein
VALLALLGVGSGVAAYSVTQVARHGCVVPLCPPAVAADPDLATFPPTVEGLWTGTVQQSDGRAWLVELRFNPGAAVGTVLYPDLRCTGTVTFVREDGAGLHAREKITAGDCTPGGVVTLVPHGTALDWTYRPDDDFYTAAGTLSRAAPSS